MRTLPKRKKRPPLDRHFTIFPYTQVVEMAHVALHFEPSEKLRGRATLSVGPYKLYIERPGLERLRDTLNEVLK